MNKKHLVVATALAGAGAMGIIGLASAATTTGSDSLAQALAQKFNLKQSDVQSVIDQHRTDMQADREKAYEDRLAKAVTDGKLTADQKTKILAKHKELMGAATSLKDKTPAERRDAMQKQRDDISAWEKANNIPAGYLGGMGGRHFDHRFGGGHDRG